MILIFYKYLNEYLNNETIVVELEKLDNKADDVLKLIDEIKKANNKYKDDFKKSKIIMKLFLENKTYNKLASNISNKDLANMVVSIVNPKCLPYLKEEEFKDILNELFLENDKDKIWKFIFNYREFKYDLSMYEDYLIKSLDTYFINEYIDTLKDYINKDKLIIKISNTKNKKFINKLIDENKYPNNFTKEEIEALKKW